jgi:hypothetical protein
MTSDVEHPERGTRILSKLKALMDANPDLDLARIVSSALRSRMWRRYAHLSRHLNDPKGVPMNEELLMYMLAFDDIGFEKALDEWTAQPNHAYPRAD